MTFEFDDEAFERAVGVAMETVSYDADYDYGYGGDLYEIYRVDNWREVVRAVVMTYMLPDQSLPTSNCCIHSNHRTHAWTRRQDDTCEPRLKEYLCPGVSR